MSGQLWELFPSDAVQGHRREMIQSSLKRVFPQHPMRLVNRLERDGGTGNGVQGDEWEERGAMGWGEPEVCLGVSVTWPGGGR